MNQEVSFTWLDLETTGLDPDQDKICEWGIILTDLHLNEIASAKGLITPPNWQARMAANPLVWDMHTKSGLINDLYALEARAGKNAFDYVNAEFHIESFMEEMGVEPGIFAMAGSNIQYDRSMLFRQMPNVLKHFHYRNEDVSGLKQWCRKFNPALYLRLEESRPKEEPKHRVLEDIRDSIDELKFYGQEFLLTDIDFAHSF